MHSCVTKFIPVHTFLALGLRVRCARFPGFATVALPSSTSAAALTGFPPSLSLTFSGNAPVWTIRVSGNASRSCCACARLSATADVLTLHFNATAGI